MARFIELAKFIDELGFTPQPDLAEEVAELRRILPAAIKGDLGAKVKLLELCSSLRFGNIRGELRFSSSVALARALGRVLIGYHAGEIASDLAEARAAALKEKEEKEKDELRAILQESPLFRMF